MNHGLATGILLLGVALQGSAAFGKDIATRIELSVTADGGCQARIGDQTIAATEEELTAKLPVLVPDRKAPLRLGAGYEKVPYRCFTPLVASLQRLGYGALTLEMEPPPLGPEIKTQDNPAQ